MSRMGFFRDTKGTHGRKQEKKAHKPRGREMLASWADSKWGEPLIGSNKQVCERPLKLIQALMQCNKDTAKERGISGRVQRHWSSNTRSYGCDTIPEQKDLQKPGMMPRLQVLATDRIAVLSIRVKKEGVHTLLWLYAELRLTATYLCSNVRWTRQHDTLEERYSSEEKR